MNTSNFIYQIITLVIAVILVCALAIPVIQDAMTEDTTVTITATDSNSGAAVTYAAIEDSDVIEIEFVLTAIDSFKVNDTAVTVPTTYAPLIFGPGFALFVYDTENVLVFDSEYVGSIQGFVSISDGMLSYGIASGSTTASVAVTEAYYYVASGGTYGAYSASSIDIAVNPDSTAYYTAYGGSNAETFASGTVSDMSVVSVYNSGAVTDATVEFTYSTVTDQYAKNVTGVTVTNAISTNGYVLAPVEYGTTYTETTTGGDYDGLFAIIPVLMIVAIVLMAVRMYGGRAD